MYHVRGVVASMAASLTSTFTIACASLTTTGNTMRLAALSSVQAVEARITLSPAFAPPFMSITKLFDSFSTTTVSSPATAAMPMKFFTVTCTDCRNSAGSTPNFMQPYSSAFTSSALVRSVLKYSRSPSTLIVWNATAAAHSLSEATNRKRSVSAMNLFDGNTSFFSTFSTTASTLCSMSIFVPSSTPTKPGIDFTWMLCGVSIGVSSPKP